MNESTKTIGLVVLALSSVVLAFIARPAPIGVEPDEQIGQVLFPEFSDPLTAKGLEVVSYDEEQGKLNTFKVTQKEKGVWVIPSHQSYPADAENRLEQAATMFVDLKVVNVVSELEGSHPEFGVVEPKRDDTDLGDQGVGTLVTIYGGESGQTKLTELIIGKGVKGSEGQYYARLPGKPRVYQLKLDPSKLSTKFQDWIEVDLLKLNPFDIASVTMRDYSLDVGLGGQASLDERMQMTVHEESGQWKVDELLTYQQGASGLQPAQLADGESPNKEKLNQLKDSLDELKIVDVERKPKGLGANLKADADFLNSREAVQSLADRGFYPIQARDGSGGIELLSNDGELEVRTKEGVQYALRFGQIAGMGAADAGADEGSVNRYMFVTASVNESQFPEPEYQPVPEAAGPTPSKEQDDSAKTDEDGQKADKEKSDESKPSEDPEVERIKRENQRKKDEWEEKREKARKQVAELNYRFADWYYIVSDDVFKKVRLRRDDMISYSPEAIKSGSSLQSFRTLESEGVKPEKKPATTEEPIPSFPTP